MLTSLCFTVLFRLLSCNNVVGFEPASNVIPCGFNSEQSLSGLNAIDFRQLAGSTDINESKGPQKRSLLASFAMESELVEEPANDSGWS